MKIKIAIIICCLLQTGTQAHVIAQEDNMSIKKIEAGWIPVKNFATSRHFFEDILGLKIVRTFPESDKKAMFQGSDGGTMLWVGEWDATAQFDTSETPGKNVFLTFTVDDIEATKKNLEAKGVTFLYDVTEGPHIKITAFLDPDGNEFHMMQYLVHTIRQADNNTTSQGDTMSIKKIESGWIPVKNFETSRHFFEDILGLKVVLTFPESDKKVMFQGKDGGTMLWVGEWNDSDYFHTSETPGKNVFLTFTVDNIEATRKALEAQGVEFLYDITELNNRIKITSFLDPDGNQFDLIQHL